MGDHAAATIYVVDDDEPVRDSIKMLLEAHCFDVRDYASAQDFLMALDGAADGRRCLVLDLHMPMMSGLDLVRHHAARIAGIPIIFITGRLDPATHAQLIEAGALDVLEKPFEDDDLLGALARALPPVPLPITLPSGTA